MAKMDKLSGNTNDLRRLAENDIQREGFPLPEDMVESMTPEEIREMLHELRVHQIELERQNEELRRSHARLDALRTCYFDLYDLAPVGYCTLSDTGLIRKTNLSASTLLGIPRGELIAKPITRFILKEDQDIYYLHHKQLKETKESHSCELRMAKGDGTQFWAKLVSATATDEDGNPEFRIVLTDISERKQLEDDIRRATLGYQNEAIG